MKQQCPESYLDLHRHSPSHLQNLAQLFQSPPRPRSPPSVQSNPPDQCSRQQHPRPISPTHKYRLRPPHIAFIPESCQPALGHRSACTRLFQRRPTAEKRADVSDIPIEGGDGEEEEGLESERAAKGGGAAAGRRGLWGDLWGGGGGGGWGRL